MDDKHSKNKRRKVSDSTEVPVYSSEEEGSSDEELPDSLQLINPEIPKSYLGKDSWARLIIILEQANLETTKSKRGIELINCDDH